jgi:hypothetical protein
MSPALVAEYQTRLPDKHLLQAKLHEFYEQAQMQVEMPSAKPRKLATRQSKKPGKARKK